MHRSIFIRQTAKIVEVMKTREGRQKAIPPQFSAPLNKSKLIKIEKSKR